MVKRLSKGGLFLLFLICSVCDLSLAQVRTTGQLSGTVVDLSGAFVAGTTITVSQASMGFSH